MLIHYRWLQSPSALRKAEHKNFLGKMARMQWWYVDVVTDDGSVLMVAYVPKKWWPDEPGASLDDALVSVSWLKAGEPRARTVSKTLDASRQRSSDQGLRLEIPGAVSITREPGDLASYRFTFDLEEIKGSLEVRALAPPFSAFPGGSLPGIARSALLGSGGLGGQPWDYVSYVPRGAASASLSLGGERVEFAGGHAYHEQGRFDEPPERLSKGWLWCHFLHPEWNIFGSPGVFMYVQHQKEHQPEKPVFYGFNLFDRSMGFKNKKLSGEGQHHKQICGGEMRFAYDGLKLAITADPDGNKPLISFPAATTRQIYHTQVTGARMAVERGGSTQTISGQIVLESCWLSP